MQASVFLDRKLGRRRGQVNALGGLVYLQDDNSKHTFLVDTGAAVSVLPHKEAAAPSGPPLAGADGKTIPSWESVTCSLSFGMRTFLWRPCGDYRRLNLATKHDRYPLPSILDLSAKLHGCKFFSVIDLVKGYHQVSMSPADIQKTAIITPFGLFEYLFMPFGLMNAAQTFQRLMDRLFRGLPFVFTYLDDHLIASRTLEEHMEHLSQFFQVLQDNGLVINPAKCSFASFSVKFLGHMVSESGITPLPVHVKAIQEFPAPSTVKQLQQFLGMITFIGGFCRKLPQPSVR